MNSGTKSDLLLCVSELVPHHDKVKAHEAHMVIIDGAAVVKMIKPRTPVSFDWYVTQVMEYVRKQFRGDVQRVDMVFDAYWKDSLKAATRTKRGKCIRRNVEGNKQVPSNWQEFLRIDENKSELFHLTSDRLVDEEFPGQVIVTRDDEVLSSAPCDLAGLMSCTHEETDTRMFVHATDGAEHGMNKILLRTVDTDVVVIGISMAQKIGCDCLWLAFGTGTSPRFRYLDATAMAQAFGDAKCGGVPAFRALTGCDVTSSFAGKGKRTAWTAWDAHDDATSDMCTLSRMPTTETVMIVLPIIKRLIVIMYDRGSSESSENGERLVLFTQQVKEIENIPPTQDAPAQHVLTVGCEAGHVWGQATIKAPQLPSPDFGWTWEVATAQWNMKWMTFPPDGAACRAVIKYGCTKGCRSQCKCNKADLTCTMFCQCGGC